MKNALGSTRNDVNRLSCSEESDWIVKYLKDFIALHEKAFGFSVGMDSKFFESIQLLIDFHSSETKPTHYMFNTIFKVEHVGSKERKTFHLHAPLYFLERRCIAIFNDRVRLFTGRSCLPITSNGVFTYLGQTFGLTIDERVSATKSLSLFEDYITYLDSDDGDLRHSKFPPDYSESYMVFSDKAVELFSLETDDVSGSRIPVLKLNSTFSKPNDDAIQKLERLLLFISDYDVVKYKRLCKMIAYVYTHKTLEKLFALRGSGRNGKGLFLKLISAYCGQSSESINSLIELQSSTKTTRESKMLDLLSARAVLVEEEDKFNLNTFNQCYKNIVSGGNDIGRRLGMNSQTQSNEAVFYAATNCDDFSFINDGNHAALDRIIFTDFTNKFLSDRWGDADKQLVADVFDDPEGRVATFKNITNLVFKVCNGDKKLRIISSQDSSKDLSDGYTEADAQRGELFLRLAQNNFELLTQRTTNSDYTVAISKLTNELSFYTSKSLEVMFNGIKGVSVKRGTRGVPTLSISKDYFDKHIKKIGCLTTYDFSAQLDSKRVLSLTDSWIRVTEVAYECGVRNVAKSELITFFAASPDVAIRFIEGQPFIKGRAYLNDSDISYLSKNDLNLDIRTGEDEAVVDLFTDDEAVVDLFTDDEAVVDLFADDEAVIDLFADDDAVVDLFVRCEPCEYSLPPKYDDDKRVVSVFDEYTWVANGTKPAFYTSEPMRITSDTSRLKKSQLLKLLPYKIPARGSNDEIEPSRLLAMDYDDTPEGTTILDVIDELIAMNVHGLIQESMSSRLNGSPFKFHLIVLTDKPITSYNYKSNVDAFIEDANNLNLKILPRADRNFRYTSLLNVSHHNWFATAYDKEFKTVDVEPPNLRSKDELAEYATWGEDKDTLEDYLICAPHLTAKTFLEMLHLGTYSPGSRDNLVYQICSFLNDSLISFGMRPTVWEEGYERLSDIVETHPCVEGKDDLLRKIEKFRGEIEL